MRKVPATVLSLLVFALLPAAQPAKAVGNALPTPQAQCAAGNPPRGEGKFNGQISGGPSGTSFEVTSGNESVLVHYNNGVQVCEGGQPAPLNRLSRGASVLVYGPMQRIGRTEEMNATRILIAGQPLRSGTRGSAPVTSSNIDRTRGAVAPVNNPNSGMGQNGADPNNDPNSGRVQSGGQSTGGNDNYNNNNNNYNSPPAQGGSDPGYGNQNDGNQGNGNQGSGNQGYGNQNNGMPQTSASDSMGGARGGRSPKGDGISCTSLQFSMNSPRDEHTGVGSVVQGAGAGKMSSTGGIICKMPVDQLVMQLSEDALKARHLSSEKLNWQNQLEVSMTNVEISSVLFTSDNGSQVVEVTFTSQKAEVVYLPSGTRVTF
ncbi:MAG TPA: hypothetical protein VG033_00405 [Candidatus Acidoferrales bacterium]|nr:hypothetical protein [Candidatus Acidoferrales bacterium]